jgi:hypothetical protein
MRHHRAIRPLAIAAVLGSLCTPALGSAQGPRSLARDSISLHDLAAFADASEGWRIVGGAMADRERDHRVATEPGTGTLVNLSAPGRGGDLRTAWEHGDIDIELDFMMPKGSNSGIYFQGRYELQLLDSWGVENPTYSDVGGIYQRWDEARGEGREGFEGHAPRVNAARAPGLWQTLRVDFRAPRFDAQGRKIGNARFARVELNGVVLHENVELTGPTRGASVPGEGPMGPIVIQGDHGPVAFRAIRYARYGLRPLQLSDIRFRAYEGAFGSLPDPGALDPSRTGEAEAISASAAGAPDRFALLHEGMVDVPTSGNYRFDLRLNWVDEGGAAADTQGGARLSIGGREVLLHRGAGRSATAEVELTAGRHPFTLEMFKNREGRPASFTLFAEGPGVRRQALHEEAGPPRGNAAGAIVVDPDDEPYLLRSFVNHGEEKLTHVVSVGDPAGVHYSYDAEQGSLIAAWRGPFMETTEMWRNRGEPQLAVPLGSVVSLPGAPAVAVLPDPSTAWPDSMAAGYRFLGYDLDEARRPVFRYRLDDVAVEDRLGPAEGRRGLARELRATGPEGAAGLHLRLAAGEEIERLRDGSYLVDGRFYVVPARGTPRPLLRAVEGGQELLVPLSLRRGGAAVSYEIIW